jgi:hypothetical protein
MIPLVTQACSSMKTARSRFQIKKVAPASLHSSGSTTITHTLTFLLAGCPCLTAKLRWHNDHAYLNTSARRLPFPSGCSRTGLRTSRHSFCTVQMPAPVLVDTNPGLSGSWHIAGTGHRAYRPSCKNQQDSRRTGSPIRDSFPCHN